MNRQLRKILNTVWSEEKRIAALPFKLEDVRVIIFHGDINSASHDAMWGPVLARTGLPHLNVFAMRRRKPWRRDDRPSIHLDSIEEFDRFISRLPNLQAALYPSNNSRNAWLVRFNHIRHVFVGHGDSDKPSSANRMFRLYDEVWTAGEAHVDRFARLDADFSSIRFVRIGQPWLKEALEKLQPESQQCLTYLPTWRGYFTDSRFSSTGMADRMFNLVKSRLGGDMRVFVKAHPWTKSSEAKTLAAAGKAHGNTTILPKAETIWNKSISGSRFFICDTSAIITECLFFDRPILQYVPPQSELFRKEYDWTADYTYKFSNLAQFEAIIDRVIAPGQDSQAEARRVHLAYRVDIDKTRQDRFSAEIHRLVGHTAGLEKNAVL